MAKCVCPFCDSEIDEAIPICQMCRAAVLYCSDCHVTVEKGSSTCPRCGKAVEASRPADESAEG